jgi:hypothetical protein
VNVEDLLRDGLHAEAARTDHVPTPLEQVAWRARSVRRTRRARVAAVSLVAAAAVATPVALTVPGLLADDRDEDRASQVFGSLPESYGPTVAWVDGDRYHSADGQTSPLGVTDVQSFVPFRGGLLATLRADLPVGQSRVVTVDPDGSIGSDECGSPRLGLDQEGEVAVSLTVDECSPRWSGAALAWQDVRSPEPDDDLLAMPTDMMTDPVAVRGDLTFYNAAELDGREPGAYRLVTGLGPPERIPGLGAVVDVTLDGGWVAGTTTDGREVVADAASGEVRAELPSRAMSFSPDGEHVAAVSLSDGRLEVLDAATGALVVATDAGTFDGRFAWESDDRLLAVAVDGDHETLVRVDLDGTVSRASEVRPAGSLSLVTQP